MPFIQWEVDILDPFPVAPRHLKFLLAAINYFTKWVEANPLATIIEWKVENLV